MYASYSSLKNCDPPSKYLFYKEKPFEQTAAMALGSAVHKLVLEADDFEEEYQVVACSTRNTKIYERAEEENASLVKPKTLLLTKEYDKAKAISESVLSTAGEYFTGGLAEKQLYWVQPIKEVVSKYTKCLYCETPFLTETLTCPKCGKQEYGMLCTMKLDYLNELGITDLKTASSVNEKEFFWDARKRMYHMQAAFYLQGMAQPLSMVQENKEQKEKSDSPEDAVFVKKLFQPDNFEPFNYFFEDVFYWVAVETSEPYLTRVFTPDTQLLEHGKSLWLSRLETLHRCHNTDNFPGYEGVTVLQYRG